MPLPMFLSLIFIYNNESNDDKNGEVFDDKVGDDEWVDPSENVSIIGPKYDIPSDHSWWHD